jgi:hypothetical protein
VRPLRAGRAGECCFSLRHAGRDTPRPCQPNGVWLGCTARRGECRRFVLALAALTCAAPTRCSVALAMQLHGAASSAARFLHRRSTRRSASSSGGQLRAVRGDAPRAAWEERAAHADDFDDDDEPCSARRRAIAQGGSRAAAMNRVRPRPLFGCTAALHVPTQRLTCDLALHKRAEARVALQRAAVTATTPSWAAPRSDARLDIPFGRWRCDSYRSHNGSEPR